MKIYQKSLKIIKNHQKSSKIVDFDDFWDPRRFRPEGPKMTKKRQFLTIFGSKMIGKAMEP
jgi:hypothetical protein